MRRVGPHAHTRPFLVSIDSANLQTPIIIPGPVRTSPGRPVGIRVHGGEARSVTAAQGMGCVADQAVEPAPPPRTSAPNILARGARGGADGGDLGGHPRAVARQEALVLLARRARIALGTATQCTRRNDSPPRPRARARSSHRGRGGSPSAAGPPPEAENWPAPWPCRSKMK
jgi:hypothetical protein